MKTETNTQNTNSNTKHTYETTEEKNSKKGLKEFNSITLRAPISNETTTSKDNWIFSRQKQQQIFIKIKIKVKKIFGFNADL